MDEAWLNQVLWKRGPGVAAVAGPGCRSDHNAKAGHMREQCVVLIDVPRILMWERDAQFLALVLLAENGSALELNLQKVWAGAMLGDEVRALPVILQSDR